MRRLWTLLLVLAFVPVATPAEWTTSDPVTVNALAVAQTSAGLEGITATVTADIIADGEGRVFVQTQPLAQTDMQGSARLAARVAADLLGLDWRDYDYLVTFRSGSTVIGGPSAGSAMSLAMAVGLWNLEHPDDPWTVDDGVAATGTINPDGTIGPVGGVPAKAEGAADAGLDTVAYPAGQERFEVRQGGQTAVATMDGHCDRLGIACQAATSLSGLVAIATGRQIDRPEPQVPATADFEAQLEPSVRAQVEGLGRDLDAAGQRAAGSAVNGSARRAVEDALDEAAGRLADAQGDLSAKRYYLAATQAFRGQIQARFADAMMDLHAGEPDRSTVAAHVDECRDAIDSVDVPSGADDWTAVQALGAAQTRIGAADALHAQAQGSLDRAVTVGDWESSLFASSFCIERAATVTWWAGLRDSFPAGAPLASPDTVVQDALDRAREMVAYAQAVLGDAGDAGQRLQEAHEHRDAGRWPAALLAAAQSEALASVALQTGTGAQVSPAVLDEARQGAARAVAAARETGTEPIVSVSLIELSSDQDDASALTSLWTARAVALLPTQGFTGSDAPDVAPSQQEASAPIHLAAGLLAGILLGAGAVLTMWVVFLSRPR